MYLIEGLFLGLASIIFIGPVVFELINASIIRVKFGVSVALGIILANIIYAFVAYNSLSFLVGNQSFNIVLAYAGFAIPSALGLLYFRKKAPKIYHKSHYKNRQTNKEAFGYFLKGFVICFFNPFVLSVWLMIVNYTKTKHTNHVILYLIAGVLAIFIIDLLKVYITKSLSQSVNPKKIPIFYKISGVIMIGYALRILYIIF